MPGMAHMPISINPAQAQASFTQDQVITGEPGFYSAAALHTAGVLRYPCTGRPRSQCECGCTCHSYVHSPVGILGKRDTRVLHPVCPVTATSAACRPSATPNPRVFPDPIHAQERPLDGNLVRSSRASSKFAHVLCSRRWLDERSLCPLPSRASCCK